MERKLRILVLEDSPTDAEVIEDTLRESGIAFSARRVETREEFVRALDDFSPDVILADYRLPRFDGLSALRLAQESNRDTPVIIVPGTVRDEAAVELLREGASDYVLKDRLSRLPSAVRSAIERKRSEEELRLAHERLHRLVNSNIIGVIIGNAAGAIIEANDYYLNLIGFTRTELEQGKVDWRAITPPEWLPADEKAIRELRERGTCTSYEKEYVRRDGARVAVLIADTMLPGPDVQIAALILDITERKAAERRLHEQLDELRRFQKTAVDRELRMRELKEENRRLREQLAARGINAS